MADEPAGVTPAETPAETPPATPEVFTRPEDEAGKKALEDERKARRDAESAAKKLQGELETLRTASLSDQEKAVEKAKQEGRSEATAAANARILRSEVKALAAGKLNDPNDAVRMLDLDQFTVSDDGEVPTDEITKEIEALIKSKPYLAATGSLRPGDADGGPRGKTPKPAGTDMDALLRGLVKGE